MQTIRWRKGFGLIQALMIILLVSGMMMVVLKYASISAKHTSDSYIREQAELFLNSAIEQTLLQISDYNRSKNGGSCLQEPNITSVTKRDINYTADVNIMKYYLQKNSEDLRYCKNTNPKLAVKIGDGSGRSHGMVLLEVEVNATRNRDHKVISRILRRTLQQP